MEDPNISVGLEGEMDSVEFVESAQQNSNQIISAHYEETNLDSEHAIEDIERLSESHTFVDLTKQTTITKSKRIIESTGSCKQQVKEDDAELRKLLEELRKKVNDFEKSTRENRTVEKLGNQLALLEDKLNREIAAKKEIEKRLLDQTKRKGDLVKQELLRQITEQMNQHMDKKIKESEMKVSKQASVNLEKLKQEVLKVVSSDVNKQLERQGQESRKKIAEQLVLKTDAEIQKLATKTTDRLDKQLVDMEKMLVDKFKCRPNLKMQSPQVSQQTEKKIYKTLVKTTSDASRKTQLAKGHTKKIQSVQAEHKEIHSDTDNQIHEGQQTEISKQFEEKTVHQMGDVTDSQKPERVVKMSKELATHVERQGMEVQSKVLAELQTKCKDLSVRMERQVLEQVIQAVERQAQGLQKQCDALVSEQIKKEMSEMKNFVVKSMGTEMGKQVAELQKTFGKELKTQKQQLEQSNQQFTNQLCNAQESACVELKKTAERDKEELMKVVEAKSSLHYKNNTAEFQKRMIEELKIYKQELLTASQKNGAQLQELLDNANKQLSKKNEADKDKLIRNVDERVVQQSKVNENELQKRIAKELKLQKLELVQENQQFTAQLHDYQENALKQVNKKVEVDKEKWMKYFEDRLNQQMKSHLNVLSKQMLLEKQELLQANQHSVNQLMGLQEMSTNKFGKKLESQKQGLLSDFKSQLFEEFELRLTSFKNEACPRPQEDVTDVRKDLMQYVDKRVQEINFERNQDADEETTRADGVIRNGAVSTMVLDHEDFKREIVSEIETNLFEKLRNSDYAANGNSVVGEDNVDSGENSSNGLPGVMSHFEHFEAMQRKIFNKQFGSIVNEAHTKIMAVVNELSGPKHDEMMAAVTLRVNGQLVDMQNTLLSHIDAEIRNQMHGVLKCIGEKHGGATESNGHDNIQNGFSEGVEVGKQNCNNGLQMAELHEVKRQFGDTQTTLMKEWHEENSKLVQLPHGNLINAVDHKEEIRRLIKEEMVTSSRAEDCYSGSNDTGATTYVWRITNFTKKFDSLKTGHAKQITSNEFTVQGTPLKLKAHLMNSQMSHWLSLVMAFVKPDDLEEKVAKSAYSHKRTFVLVDQSQAAHRRDRVIVREPGFRDEGIDKWMSRFYGPLCFAQANALGEDSIYVKNDTLIIKIILEQTHTLYRNMRNDDGVLFWKIDNYGAKKQTEMDGLVECLYSDYFSTSPKGYRMQVRAYLNGDDLCESKHLSVYLYFRRGQHDEFIASCFPHKVTFTVLDQSESGDRKDICKTMESDGHILSAYGFREFALQSEVESPEYLKNDTLLLKVEVVPLTESRLSYGGRIGF